MPAGGSIRIGLRRRTGPAEGPVETGPEAGAAETRQKAGQGDAYSGQLLSLTVEDSGPGIPRKALDRIFEAGFSTRAAGNAIGADWPLAHRGLGLSICRSIIETTGGHIYATNRHGPGAEARGACFEIVLPVRSR
jgi:signal transduction histidine kinase